MSFLVPEILTEVHNAKSDKDRKRILSDVQNNTPALRFILRLTYSPWITLKIPFPKNFQPDSRPVGLTLSNLNGEYKRLLVFTNLDKREIDTIKLNKLFVSLLSGIHANEVKLLEFVWQRSLPINGLSANLVNDIFPGLLDVAPYHFPDDVEEKVVMVSNPQKFVSPKEIKQIAEKIKNKPTEKKRGRPNGSKTKNHIKPPRKHGPDGKFLPSDAS